MKKIAVSIYTLGYGNRSIEVLVGLLHQYGITYLADTRSVPYSRYRPIYRKSALKAHVEAAGFGYEYLGDRLGGKPDVPECYTHGRADYAKIRQQTFFQAGLARLLELAEAQRLAVLCAELSPRNCHRAHLIGVALDGMQVTVLHIDEHGKLLAHAEVMAERPSPQLPLLA